MVPFIKSRMGPVPGDPFGVGFLLCGGAVGSVVAQSDGPQEASTNLLRDFDPTCEMKYAHRAAHLTEDA